MKSDYEMVTHRFPGPITIYPVGDVHYGALEHMAKEWRQFCDKVLSEPDSYVVLVGDLVNNSIKSSVANPFDEVVRPRDQKEHMVEFLRPLKERILCAVSGNHEYRSKRDTDSDITYDIMARLQLEDLYRENAVFMKVGIGERPESPNRTLGTFTFCVTHGSGGGIYTGAAVNRNERFANVLDGCDCLITGHTHKGTVTHPTKLVIDPKNECVSVVPYTVVSCESWMSYGGYAMRKMLLPSESGYPQRLRLTAGSKQHRRNKRIEVIW